MKYSSDELQCGAEALRTHIEALRDEDPELGDFHEAFEQYCVRKFSLGTTASTVRVGGKNQKGIDFYSTRDAEYTIGQCKIPEVQWLTANPNSVKSWGPQGVNDLREALRFLFGQPHETQTQTNPIVAALFAQLQQDRLQAQVQVTVFLVVYGMLNGKGKEDFEAVKSEWEQKVANLKVELYELEDLVEEFLLGTSHSTGEIEFDLKVKDSKLLSMHDFCYFLANAADIHRAFVKFGWRLFNLNVRYEIKGSSVNGDIVESLEHQKTRKRFHHYNNGLVILVENFNAKNPQVVKVKKAQIVNGLQTVKSIHNAVSSKKVTVQELEADCVVQVKVIRNDQPDFVDTVVETTNNQNPMNPRNLKSHTREQRILQTTFKEYNPRWFYQLKEGQWNSLTEEDARFFKPVVGYSVKEFKPDPHKKAGRVIDNEDLAKAWLAFLGFADKAADRVTHFFSENDLYHLSFNRKPTAKHWEIFASQTNFFDSSAADGKEFTRWTELAIGQASPEEYFAAYALMDFAKNYVPSPKQYRELALQEGVVDGAIEKSGGSFKVSAHEEEKFLSTSATYQTWRLLANMKELLVELATHVLARRYGNLSREFCQSLLETSDLRGYTKTAELRDVARAAASASDLPNDAVIARLFGFIRFVATQFWEEKHNTLLSTSRIRTILIRREVAAEFKKKIWEVEKRKTLDRAWKPEGVTFLESLPDFK
ncbi:MAG: AIPR family protein [Bryobacteraceae bacterium]|nr:AIPR family protein [Bryobacteraceae bacterium]